MPLQRNEFVPQSILTVYPSASGMVDIRTGQPYNAGGLMTGVYFDLTEAEAQALSGGQCHEGRYRFVQIDSGATAANIAQGTVGLLKTVAKGVNVITSYDQGLNGGIRPVIFLAPVTSAQVAAGAYVFVQEAGLATVLTKAAGVTNVAPAIGDVANSIATGTVDDPTANTTYVPTTIGVFVAAPSHSAQGLVLVALELPLVQG